MVDERTPLDIVPKILLVRRTLITFNVAGAEPSLLRGDGGELLLVVAGSMIASYAIAGALARALSVVISRPGRNAQSLDGLVPVVLRLYTAATDKTKLVMLERGFCEFALVGRDPSTQVTRAFYFFMVPRPDGVWECAAREEQIVELHPFFFGSAASDAREAWASRGDAGMLDVLRDVIPVTAKTGLPIQLARVGPDGVVLFSTCDIVVNEVERVVTERYFVGPLQIDPRAMALDGGSMPTATVLAARQTEVLRAQGYQIREAFDVEA